MADGLILAIIIAIILSLFWNKMPKATRAILIGLLVVCFIPIIALLVMIAQNS